MFSYVSEETCDPRKQRFEGYGLTTGKDGSHRLTGKYYRILLLLNTNFFKSLVLQNINHILSWFQGPGLSKSSGVAHMGGKTPTRLVDSCSMYLEADETAIYEAWVRGNKTVIW